MKKNGPVIRGVLDRVEERLAVIVLDRGGEIVIPLERLPEGSNINTVFDIEFKINEEEKEKRLEEIEKMQDELKNQQKGDNA